jgi:hypothetical protein
MVRSGTEEWDYLNEPDKTRKRKNMRFCRDPFMALLTLLALSVNGCATKVIRMEGDPAFLSIRNVTFVLKRDAYVFRENGQRGPQPFLGCISGEPGIRIPQFPERMAPALIGKEYHGFRFLGAVPKDTRFRVVGLKRLHTPETTLTSFEIMICGQDELTWGVLDGLWITDETDFDRPHINSVLADVAP